MRQRIPITSPRAVQLVVLVAAAILLANAYWLATEGHNFYWYRCTPPWEPPVSSILAGVRGGVAVGLLVAALHAPLRGVSVRDPLLIGMFLVLGASATLESGIRALVTGTIYLGRRGCVDFGPPISYPIGAILTILGTLLLVGAGIVLLQGVRGEEGDDN